MIMMRERVKKLRTTENNWQKRIVEVWKQKAKERFHEINDKTHTVSAAANKCVNNNCEIVNAIQIK